MNYVREQVRSKVSELLDQAKYSNALGLRTIIVKLMMMCGDEITEEESDYIHNAVKVIHNYLTEWN
jgi:hypothetical protein